MVGQLPTTTRLPPTIPNPYSNTPGLSATAANRDEDPWILLILFPTTRQISFYDKVRLRRDFRGAQRTSWASDARSRAGFRARRRSFRLAELLILLAAILDSRHETSIGPSVAHGAGPCPPRTRFHARHSASYQLVTDFQALGACPAERTLEGRDPDERCPNAGVGFVGGVVTKAQPTALGAYRALQQGCGR